MEKRYSISDAARQVNVEAHVLRYWEEELGFTIPRNSQGHRYYREKEIRMLQKIKDLKEQGFQLRAIKLLMPDMERTEHMTSQELYRLREELNQQVQMDEEKKSSYAKMGQVMPMPNIKAVDTNENSLQTQSKKLEQFEVMLRTMIRETLQEEQSASEKRICEVVSERMIKEMDYLIREREELQVKQVELLQQILTEMRPTATGEAAVSEEPEMKVLRSHEKKKNKKRKKFHLGF